MKRYLRLFVLFLVICLCGCQSESSVSVGTDLKSHDSASGNTSNFETTVETDGTAGVGENSDVSTSWFDSTGGSDVPNSDFDTDSTASDRDTDGVVSGDGIEDNRPPKLISFRFLENQQFFAVGDTVHVEIDVTDDSGIDVSRTYPVVSNGDHYINFEMHYNEEPGLLEGSYTFKPSDVMGKYSLGYVPCYDVYGNYYHGILSDEMDHFISLTSGGVADNTPPELISFEFVEQGRDFSVGETVHVRIKVTDDSGINVSRTYPVVSNGQQYINFKMQYNAESGYLEGSYTFQPTDVMGKYSLGYIPCYDVFDNYYHGILTDGTDHYVTLASGGISDSKPPELISFEFVEQGQSLVVGETVHVRIKVTDESGINVSRTYPVVYNGDHYINFNMEYNESTGFLEGSYTFKPTDVLGKYTLGYIPCYDIYENYYHGILSDGKDHFVIFAKS